MSSLSDDLDGVRRSDRKNLVAIALDDFAKEDPEKAEQLLTALRDQEHYSTLDLAAVLTKHGYQMSRSTVQIWRSTDKAQHPEIYEGQKVRGSEGGQASAAK